MDLKVGIDRNDGPAPRMIEAGGKCGVLAEVSRQADNLDAGVADVMTGKMQQGQIAAAVVHADDFVVGGDRPQHRFEAIEEQGRALFLIVHRHHHRKQWRRNVVPAPSVVRQFACILPLHSLWVRETGKFSMCRERWIFTKAVAPGNVLIY